MYIVGKYNIYLYDLLKEEGHECHIYIKAHVTLRAIIVISVVLIHYYKTVFPKEYELLDQVSSLLDIHILHRVGAQIPTGHLVQ